MAIRLYNTKTRSKEAFEPLDAANVRMYVCGPTVYDRAHIGNARPVVVFDVLYRLLRHEYGEKSVIYVRNFTDVDDKINAKSAETGRSIRDITDETIDWYHEDMDALGALRPNHEPRATDYIQKMIAMGEGLIARGHAYEAEGHVLFEARTDPDYGSLSRRPLDEMKAGARVEVAPYKRDPMDSVIWKPSTDDQPGWESPWGRGRPGWHIECSAMAGDLLGESFDIHGGGIDLQFPHHENEWAQSRCMGHDFANVWMHNGYLQVEGEKMSKSLGNFFTVADLREKRVPGEVMRLAMLMTHYAKPLDWTEERVREAETKLNRWRRLIDIGTERFGLDAAPTAQVSKEWIDRCLGDDLNTPLAITSCGRSGEIAAKQMEQLTNGETGERWDSALAAYTEFVNRIRLLGFETLLESQLPIDKNISDALDRLLADRSNAKASKNFSRADSIRDALIAAGVEIQDTAGGAEWSLTPSFDASKLPEAEDV